MAIVMAAEASPGRQLAHDNSEFMWGEKLLDVMPGRTSYKSMRYGGMWYSVNDCAFLNPDHIGKLMSLYEENGQRKVRVRWFLRPEEFMEEPRKADAKEVFIAMCKVGVENVNLVDTILEKATVICTAVHKDNPLPNRCPDSVHHIFSKAYDTETKKLLDIHKMNADKKPLVRCFFNKPEWIQALNEEAREEDDEEFTEDSDVDLNEETFMEDDEEFTGDADVEPMDEDAELTDEDVQEITGEEFANKRPRML